MREIATAERTAEAIQDKLDRLDEAFLFDRSIGNGFVRTAVTAPAFSYLRPIEAGNEGLVAQIFPRWNRVADWLREAERYSTAA